MGRFVLTLSLFVMILLLTACGAHVGGWVGGECYGCVDGPCDCADSGYGGPYNPKTLDMFRPGRFEDLNTFSF